MSEAYICDAIRTPIGKLNGSLAGVRADDLAAIPISALTQRNTHVDWSAVDDVILGCANQAGEDNRSVARMAVLLAGLPETVPGLTVNRLCSSGLNALGMAAQAIRAGDADLVIAGGVEGMPALPMKDEMIALEARREEIEAELAVEVEPVPMLHPSLAIRYREELDRLHEGLTS